MSQPAAGSREIVIEFLYVGKASHIPEIMVASVRAAVPGARIVQMTDLDTRKVIGTDDVIRKDWDQKFLMPYRLLHLRSSRRPTPSSSTLTSWFRRASARCYEMNSTSG